MTETEILLILIGGVFVLEALSVIVQVTSFKTRGEKSVFNESDSSSFRIIWMVGS